MGDLEFQKQMVLKYYYMSFYTDDQLNQFVPYILSEDDYNVAVKNKHQKQQNSNTVTPKQ